MRIPFVTTALLLGIALTSVAAQPGADSPAPTTEPSPLFKRLDANGDGIIIREELLAQEAQRANQFFDRADADRDGKITAGELRGLRGDRQREGRARGAGGAAQQRLQERFRTADADGNGQLTRSEVQATMPRLAERFDALDGDRDGALSVEELRRARGAR